MGINLPEGWVPDIQLDLLFAKDGKSSWIPQQLRLRLNDFLLEEEM